MTTIEDRIREALDKHTDWGYLIRTNEMFCKGCGWVKQLTLTERSAASFRAHQAAVLAGIVQEAMAGALRDAAEELPLQGRPVTRLVRHKNVSDWLRARADRIGGGE